MMHYFIHNHNTIGTKLSAIAGNGVGYKYRGNFLYAVDASGNERLESIGCDESRVIVTYSNTGGATYKDYWQVKDHLGSVRAVYDLSTTGMINSKKKELSDFLPFGTRIARSSTSYNHWRFSGKEEQKINGTDIGLLDFGARYYDPWLSRWTTQDPLAHKYAGINPYVYCNGDPVNLVDVDGREGIVVSGQPGDHKNRLHFLENGLNRARLLQEQYNQEGQGERVTWFIYSGNNSGGYNNNEYDQYLKKASQYGINAVVVHDSDAIVDYVNNKTPSDPRINDLISDFVYIGHATPGDLDIGFIDHGFFHMLTNETLNVSKFQASAFANDSRANLVGGCRTAVNGFLPFERSVARQLAPKIGGEIRASDVRVTYPGGVVSDVDLVRPEGGTIVLIKGTKRK